MKLQNLSERFLLIAVWLVLLLSVGCGGGGGDSSPSNTTTTAIPKYTVMVYIVGSDLESGGNAGSSDLAEMMQVGSNDNLKVVVETGGANKDGWRTVQRHLINNGNITTISDIGNLSMGDPATLQDFITWAVANYPADKYALVLWDHGGGTTGFGWDENHLLSNGQKDNLTIPELRQALQNAYNTTSKTFDVIGYDACLMATVEVAHTMSPFGKYLVASEELEPGHGWNYTPILQAITNNPSIDGAALGKVIADGYKAQATDWANAAKAQGQAYNADKEITLSVIDLSKIPTLITPLDAFANSINGNLQSIGKSAWIPVSDGRSKSEEYGSNKAKGQFTDMVDLKDLANNTSSSYPTETNNLISALNQAVVYKVNGTAKPNANGLSIYLPYNTLSTPDITSNITSYNNIDFSPSYKSMVSEYVAVAQTDTTGPTFVNETVIGSTYSANVQGSDIADVYAIITQSDPAAGTVTIIGMDSVSADSNGLVSYPWTGQWLTLNGNVVSSFTVSTEGTLELLDIPALLNGQTVDILVALDTSSGQYEILGAWPGITNGMAAKEMLPIGPTDSIIPLFTSINVSTGAETSIQGTAFTVGASLQLGIGPLPSGNYELAFLAVDLAQNTGFSTFVTGSAAPSLAPSFKAANSIKTTSSTALNAGLSNLLMERRKVR